MTNEISDILQTVTNNMDSTIIGVWNGGDSRFETCQTKWSRSGKTIVDSMNDSFVINQVNPNQWLILDATPTPIQMGVVQLPKPVFVTGTKIATNREWTLLDKDLTKKTPIIWLLRSLVTEHFGRDSAFDFTVDLRLFFLDETNIVQYYTPDHVSNVVYPMEQLAMEFLSTIRKDRNFATILNWQIIDFARFGVENENGVTKNILDANLSGVELRVTLKKYKTNCKNC